MSVRPILTVGDPALRVPSRPVERHEFGSPGLARLIEDLIDTMRAANGAGLAATQIGDERRVCVVEVATNPRYPYKPPIPLTVLVNPSWRPLSSERFANNEGCLSVPGLRGVVERHTEIALLALDSTGSPIDEEVRGLSAGTFQHECDHLDGVLFLDRVEDPATLMTWESFERFHRSAFVGRVEALVARYGR